MSDTSSECNPRQDNDQVACEKEQVGNKSHTDPLPISSAGPETNPSNTEKRFIDKWKPWIEVFGIIAGIILVGCSILQWLDLKHQMRLDARAWVGNVETHLCIPYSAEQVGIITDLTNTGKTPAFVDQISLSICRSTSKDTNLVVLSQKTVSGMILAPGSLGKLTMNELGRIGQSEFDSLQKNEAFYHYHVSVTYRDIFDAIRHTDFCIIVSGTEGNMGNSFKTCGYGRMD